MATRPYPILTVNEKAARAIRALPDAKQASVPIIAVTANAFEEDKQAALDAGMNGHIPKPIHVNLLRRQLGACLRANA